MSWHVYPAAAAAAVRRSVRPCRHGTKRVLFSRHLLHVGRYSSGPPDRWVVRGHIRCRTTYIQKEKGKYGSLCLDAHKFRTPLVLRYMVLLHSTTPQTCTTLLYNLLLLTYYGDKDAVCFKSRMFCFSCSAVLLPETYGIPYHLVHIMPPCKQEAKDDAKLASSILYTLPY